MSVIEVSGSYDALSPDGSSNEGPREAVAKEFLRTHKDEYDYLVIFTNFNYLLPTHGVKGFYHSIRNDVQGIGLPLFDNSADYGSNGRLAGITDMGNIIDKTTDPLDPDFENTLSTIHHELLHRWAAQIKFKDSTGNLSTALLDENSGHWSFLLDTGGSVLYGNKWHDNGDGTFTSLYSFDEMKYYSPLDLYLMGMIGPGQVPAMRLIDNPAVSAARLPEANVAISGTARTITIEDIVAANGLRIPDATHSPKNFKTAFLLLVRPGEFSGDVIYGIENIRNAMVTRFSILTNGKSIMDVDAAQKSDVPANSGILPPNPSPRTTSADINDGIAWLVAHQGADGSWMDVLQTQERDTADAVGALVNVPIAQQAYLRGVQRLESMHTPNLDYLSRKIEVFAEAGRDTSGLVQELLGRRNPDGGWGSDSQYLSTSTDTALALRALVISGYRDVEGISSAANFLMARQNADGGWGSGDGGSLVQETAHVLWAFNRIKTIYGLSDRISIGENWLLSKQNPDGGYGNSPSTVYDTATALISLAELNAPPAVTKPAVDYLSSRQAGNGSWNDSVFQTALAVKAIQKGSIAPDLSVSSESVTFSPDTITTLPSSVVINVKVSNLGKTEVLQAVVVLYDGLVSDANKIGEKTVGVVGNGDTLVTFLMNIQDSSQHVFTVVLDPNNIVQEANKQNNKAVKELQVQDTYDVEILSPDITVMPSVVDLQKDVTITARISNKGTAAAYSVPVRFSIITAAGEIPIASVSADIPANGSVVKSIIWKASRVGANMPVVVQVDPSNLFPELSETNNSGQGMITVNALTDPNIVVSFSDMTVSPNPALEGGNATITAVVKNDGASSVAGTEVRFYSTVSGTTRQLPQDSAPTVITIPSLDPGQSYPVSLLWSGIAEPGLHTIAVRATPPANVHEIRTDDNEGFLPLTVLSLPDLAVSASSINITPEFPKSGDQTAISVTVQNNGDQEARSVLVRLQEGNTIIGEQTIPLLAGHVSNTVTFTYDTAGKDGAHDITVTVNPDNAVLERDKTNNRATRSFGVQNADFWVSERYFSPNGDKVKDTTQLFFRLPVAQNVTVGVVDEKGKTVKIFNDKSLKDITSGSVIWEGLNDDGMIVNDGDYRLRLVSSSGTVLADTPVTVDTNRLPLPAAFVTKFLMNSNLTCPLPDVGTDWRWLRDESGIVVNLPSSPTYPNGIYSISPDGVEIFRLVPYDWTEKGDGQYTYTYGLYDVSPVNGDVAFILNKNKVNDNKRNAELWVVGKDGGNLRLIESLSTALTNAFYDVKWSPAGDRVAYRTYTYTLGSGSVNQLKTASTVSSSVAIIESSGYIDPDTVLWSPDGRYIGYIIENVYPRKVKVQDVLTPAAQPQIVDASSTLSADVFSWLDPQKILIDTTGYWANSRYRIADVTGTTAPVDIAAPFISWTSASPDGAFIAGVSKPLYGTATSMFVADAGGHVSVRNTRNAGPYCQPFLSQVVWSTDGKKLAFSESFGSMEGFPECSDPVGPRLIILDAATMEEQAYMTSMTPTEWLSAGEYVLGIDSQAGSTVLSALQYGSGDIKSQPLEEDMYVYEGKLSSQERYIAFSQLIDTTNPCWRTGEVNPGTYDEMELRTLGSALNLAADLRVVKRKSGVLLRGLAADLHFDHYILEYADMRSPQVWHPILPPSDREALNELFTTWIPPATGTYLVRLTVHDKAGNAAESTRRVAWGTSTSISNVRQSTTIFSPNNDTVLETVDIAYAVLEPVNLSFQINSADNTLVRTIVMSYAEAGEGVMQWDGTNEQNVVVPDGKYVIRVLDLEFPVEVDTTLPEGSVNASLMVAAEVVQGQPPQDKTYFVLHYRATDSNIDSWNVEVEKDETIHQWSSVESGKEDTGKYGISAKTEFSSSNSAYMKNFIGRNIRIRVKDKAGNERIALGAGLPEKLFVNRWDKVPVSFSQTSSDSEIRTIPSDKAQPDLHEIAGGNTITATLASMNPQYTTAFDMIQNIGAYWIDANAVTNADVAWSTNWDNSSFGPFQAYAVRMKAVDALGRAHYSDTLYHELFSIEESCDVKAPVIGEIGLFEPLTSATLQARENPTDAAKPWSAEDIYKVYDVQKGDKMPLGNFVPPMPGITIVPGKLYEIRMTGIGASGRVYETTLTYPQNPCDLSIPIAINYPEAETCGTTSNKASIVSAWINANSPEEESVARHSAEYLARIAKLSANEVIDLSYYLTDAEGTKLVSRVTDPAEIARVWLENHGIGFELSTENLPEGRYPVSARLLYRDKASQTVKKAWVTSEVIVDRTVPTPSLSIPLAESTLCPVRIRRKSGDQSYVQLVGKLHSTDGSFSYRIKKNSDVTAKGLLSGADNLESDDNMPLAGSNIAGQAETSLGFVKAADLGEDLTLHLESYSVTGNKGCASTSFHVLPSNPLVSVSSDKSLISAMGSENKTTAHYSVNQPALVDIDVFLLAKNELLKRFEPVPPSHRHLVASEQYTGGDKTVVWDGRNDSGLPLPDGPYGVTVQATDSCGNKSVQWAVVAIDTTAPAVSILSPLVGNLSKAIVEISGSATDEHFQWYRLDAVETSTGRTSTISQSLTPITSGGLGTWTTTGLAEGEYLLQLTAHDTAGNEAVATAMVTLIARGSIINSLSVSPKIISPNGDNKYDSGRVSYDLATAANVELAVIDRNGIARKTTVLNGQAAGIHTIDILGKDNADQRLLDGQYLIQIAASLVSDPQVSQTESVSLTIDTTPPTLDVATPKDGAFLASNDLAVMGTIKDDNLSEYTVSYTGSAGTFVLAQANQSKINVALAEIPSIPEGEYTLSVIANDLAANETKTHISFTIDRTPPNLRMDSPVDGAVIGAGKDVVAVTGSLTEKNLESYSLRYANESAPTLWTELQIGTIVPAAGQLFGWHTKTVPDETYLLSFLAKDKAGLTGEAKARVTIDNTPPTVSITSPQDGALVNGYVEIKGTAFDQNLEKYAVDLSEGTCSSAFKWTTLRTGTSSVQSAGALANAQAFPKDGDYCVRLTAFDRAGASAETKVQITVDTQAPSAPSLSGTKQNQKDIQLTWSGNSETDLVGFNVYRAGQKMVPLRAPLNEYLDAGLGEGIYAYTVKAVDRAGNESAASNEVKLRVDLSGPSAAISSPRDGAMVSGYLEIRGTAFSSDDFKQYRLSLGEGVTPTTWTIIRTSSIAVSNGVLSGLDTMGFKEGQLYAIKLEAMDLAGNVTTRQITVTVDNIAPQKPLSLTATANGSDVAVSWDNNVEGDLAGFLLYSNEILVNAPSNMLTTNVLPYLLSGNSFLHKGLPDGTFSYTVVAVDKAGNMSDASLPATVVIDTRAPKLAFSAPVAGSNGKTTIGGKTLVTVTSPDSDIARLTLFYSISGTSNWISLGERQLEPFDFYFDPAALGFSYGNYDLRAEADDRHSPVPNHGVSPVLAVVYRDTTPPSVPSGLRAAVTGTAVSLSWSPVSDSDIAGYKLYRTSGTWRSLATPTFSKDTSGYVDALTYDGTYLYDITSVDASGNESKSSQSVTARIYAPVLDQASSPTAQQTILIHGSNAEGGALVAISVASQSGNATTMAVADANGMYQASATLAAGSNTLTAIATDSAGNRSRSSNTISVFYDVSPIAPTGLVASALGPNVSLVWNASPDTDVRGYHVYRSEGTEWKRITASPVSIVSWTDSGLRNGTYAYRVTAIDAISESSTSSESTATVAVDLLTPPINLTAVALENGKVDISWEYPSAPAAGYRLYRSTAPGGPFISIGAGVLSTTSFRDTALQNWTAYYYVATAVDAYGNESIYSNEGMIVASDTIAPLKPAIDTPTKAGSPIL
ncbi:MAG: Ig-like domain-containing protein, partial [Nitrospiraceae bacterium]|nr:Ig-like domain-containing protein [Nitrospiraceae bacterium]